MAYITTRNFVHRRLQDLRAFFKAHYGDGYKRILAEKCQMNPHTLADYMSDTWGKTNGRPGMHEVIRIFNVSLLEAHARDLGWRSALSVSLIKSRSLTENELID